MNLVFRVVVFFTILLLSFITVADDDDDKQPVTPKTQQVAGQTVISVDDKVQQHSGLVTQIIKPVSYQAEFTAYGLVLPIQPLLELQHHYLTALTERASASAKFKQAEQQVQRQQALYQAGISAKRNLENQQAQWHIDKAQLQAASFNDQIIKEQAQLTWGKTLTRWFLSKEDNQLKALLSGQQKVLQINLPSNQQLDNKVSQILVSATGQREHAQVAKLISEAPQTAANQGQGYFFLSSDKALSIGMSVTAWIGQQDQLITGVMIPKSALVWSMNQAFVYVKVDNEHFSRRLIEHYNVTNEGYFVSQGLKPNEEIVTTGGQMLLSEELRGQIPDED